MFLIRKNYFFLFKLKLCAQCYHLDKNNSLNLMRAKTDMENEVRLNIKITADMMNRVKTVAKEKQLTVSSLTRLLLINYVENFERERQNTESKK